MRDRESESGLNSLGALIYDLKFHFLFLPFFPHSLLTFELVLKTRISKDKIHWIHWTVVT